MSNTEGKKESRKRVLTLEVEAGGRTFDFSTQKLELLGDEPIIKLHFLRYGLFDRKSSDDETENVHAPKPKSKEEEKIKAIILKDKELHELDINGEMVRAKNQDTKGNFELEEIIISNVKGLPGLENFYSAKTNLNAGYVYIINANNQNESWELEIESNGAFREIFWESKSNKGEDGKYLDIREASGSQLTYKELDPLVEKVWVAYSPTQWSIAYHTSIKTNTEKRNKRMIEVTTTGIKKGETINNAEPYHKVKAVFKSNPENNYPLIQKLENLHTKEEKEAEEGKNIIYEDQFITLHDPISCATEICEGVDREIDRLKSIMLSCQTGMSDEMIFNTIRSNGKLKTSDNEKARQIKYLHTLAATTYRFIYDNPDLEKKHSQQKGRIGIRTTNYNPYSGAGLERYNDPKGEYSLEKGISKEKILKVLGVEERRLQRELINKYRDDLGEILLSDYYQDFFDDFVISDVLSLGAGKEVFSKHLLALGHYPNYYDRELDLVSEYDPENDKWLQKISGTSDIKTNTNFVKAIATLDQMGDVHEYHFKEHHNFLKKAVSVSKSIGKVFILHAISEKSFETMQGRVSWFRNFKTGNAILKYRDENLKAYKAIHNQEISDLKMGANKINGYVAYKNSMHLNMGKIGRREMDALVQKEILEIDLKTIPSKYQYQVDHLIKSKEFGSLVLLFEVISLTYAIESYKKEKSGLNVTLLTFSSIKVGAALYQLTENSGVLNKISNDRLSFIIKGLGQGLKLFGSIITVLVSAKDTYKSAGVHDYDAAAAWGAASFVGSIFVIAEISSTYAALGGSAFLTLGLWPAAIIGGVLITLYGIAIYLSDTEIEAYFKNFPLSNVAINPDNDQKPHEYIQNLYERREDTITTASIKWIADTQYLKFTDFETAYVGLMDIVTPGVLNLNAIKKSSESSDTANTRSSYSTRFEGSVKFFQYFEYLEQLDMQIWFYPNGIGNTKQNNETYRTQINIGNHKIINTNTNLKGTNNMPSCCEFDFEIPDQFKEKRYLKGEVLVLCRLITAKNEYIPLTHKNIGRYLCLNALMYNTISKSRPYSPLPGTGVVIESEYSNYQPLKLNRKGYPITIIEENKIDQLTS